MTTSVRVTYRRATLRSIVSTLNIGHDLKLYADTLVDFIKLLYLENIIPDPFLLVIIVIIVCFVNIAVQHSTPSNTQQG